jgi:hypothetical protein
MAGSRNKTNKDITNTTLSIRFFSSTRVEQIKTQQPKVKVDNIGISLRSLKEQLESLEKEQADYSALKGKKHDDGEGVQFVLLKLAFDSIKENFAKFDPQLTSLNRRYGFKKSSYSAEEVSQISAQIGDIKKREETIISFLDIEEIFFANEKELGEKSERKVFF